MKITYLSEGVFTPYKAAKAANAQNVDKKEQARNITAQVAKTAMQENISKVYAEFFKRTEEYTIEGTKSKNDYYHNLGPIPVGIITITKPSSDWYEVSKPIYNNDKCYDIIADYFCNTPDVAKEFFNGVWLIPCGVYDYFNVYYNTYNFFPSFDRDALLSGDTNKVFLTVNTKKFEDAEKSFLNILNDIIKNDQDSFSWVGSFMPTKIKFIPIRTFKIPLKDPSKRPVDEINDIENILSHGHKSLLTYGAECLARASNSSPIGETLQSGSNIKTYHRINFVNDKALIDKNIKYLKSSFSNTSKWFPDLHISVEYDINCAFRDLTSPLLKSFISALDKLNVKINSVVYAPIGHESQLQNQEGYYGNEILQAKYNITDVIELIKEKEEALEKFKSIINTSNCSSASLERNQSMYKTSFILNLGDKIFDKDTGWSGARNITLANQLEPITNISVQQSSRSKRDVFAWDISNTSAAIADFTKVLMTDPRMKGKYALTFAQALAKGFVENFYKLYKLRPHCVANNYFLIGDYWGMAEDSSDNNKFFYNTYKILPTNTKEKKINAILTVDEMDIEHGKLMVYCTYQTKLMVAGGLNPKYTNKNNMRSSGKNYEYISGRKFKFSVPI